MRSKESTHATRYAAKLLFAGFAVFPSLSAFPPCLFKVAIGGLGCLCANRGSPFPFFSPLADDPMRQQMPEDATALAEVLRNGIFGPLEVQPPAKTEEEDDDEDVDAPGEDDVDLSRKRIHNSVPNGSPPKRPRLSNGCESKSDAAATVSTPMAMDVDQQENHQQHDDDQSPHDDNHAYPSPLEGEQVPLPIVRTEGPEQGTQVDKVEQLFPKTTFIRLMDNCATETAPSPSPAGTENAPILLQCEWNPRDPSILAAAGTDALARVWTISRATATEHGEHHVSPRAQALLDPDAPKTTTVTALAWTSDGTAIAVASDCGGSRAAIHVWSAGGELLQSMDVAEPPIVKLLWNPSNSALLAISPENKVGTSITVHSATSNKSFRYDLSGHSLDTGLDATWTGDSEFLICGGGIFECLSVGETSIQRARKFETKEDDHFAQVLFDPVSQLVATSSDKGVLDVSLRKKGLYIYIPTHTTAVRKWRLIVMISCSCGTSLARAGPSRHTRDRSQQWPGSPYRQISPVQTMNDSSLPEEKTAPS